jgi:hypothetical protein
MTDAHKAKAREIAGILDRDVLAQHIAAALRDCEREAYERAAKVAEDSHAKRGLWIASRIRALAQEEPKT